MRATEDCSTPVIKPARAVDAGGTSTVAALADDACNKGTKIPNFHDTANAATKKA